MRPGLDPWKEQKAMPATEPTSAEMVAENAKEPMGKISRRARGELGFHQGGEKGREGDDIDEKCRVTDVGGIFSSFRPLGHFFVGPALGYFRARASGRGPRGG
jgi:hypothetical protein